MTNLRLLPNIHLLLVHLSAALLLAGTAFLIAGRLFAAHTPADSLLHAGRWNVWSGALLSIVSVATAALLISPARLDAVAAATAALHLRTAIIASVLALGAAIAIRQTAVRTPSWIVLAVLVVSCGAIGVSALAGAQLIHHHGLGIERQREEPRMPVAMVLPQGAGAGAGDPAPALVSSADERQKRNSASSDRNQTSSRPSIS